MPNHPPVTSIRWATAHRIISSRFPPTSLFEDIADPADWDAIALGESRTNPRNMAEIGKLALVPPERRVAGPGASYAMAPFVHVSPLHRGRFNDGTFGVYYAAERFETALAEKMFHSARLFAASQEEPGWFSQYRVLIGSITNEFHEIRGQGAFFDCLAPDDYSASQQLARSLRADQSNGVVYPSVRDREGECVGAFWPDVIDIPVQASHLSFHFDGSRVDLFRDETENAIYRVAEA